MRPRRCVSITSCGAMGPWGAGADALERWWKEGRPSTVRPITTFSEPWLPTEDACEVPAWRGRDHLPERKAIKLMTRRVQLGVAAAIEAWGGKDWNSGQPPDRRGMYTGCGVPADEDWTFREPIEAAVVNGQFDLVRFGTQGQELLNPLWLVKSLTNNVLAFTAKALDLQGPNNNFEGGAASALVAVGEAARAIEMGRLDIALAGAADSLVSVEALLNLAKHRAPQTDRLIPGESSCFVRLEAASAGALTVLGFGSAFAPESGPGAPTCSPQPPQEAIAEAVLESKRRAWAEAVQITRHTTPGLELLCPRSPEGHSTAARSLRPADGLGDAAAGGGALLLAAAWVIHRVEVEPNPFELTAVGPGGEAATLILGAPS